MLWSHISYISGHPALKIPNSSKQRMHLCEPHRSFANKTIKDTYTWNSLLCTHQIAVHSWPGLHSSAYNKATFLLLLLSFLWIHTFRSHSLVTICSGETHANHLSCLNWRVCSGAFPGLRAARPLELLTSSCIPFLNICLSERGTFTPQSCEWFRSHSRWPLKPLRHYQLSTALLWERELPKLKLLTKVNSLFHVPESESGFQNPLHWSLKPVQDSISTTCTAVHPVPSIHTGLWQEAIESFSLPNSHGSEDAALM